MGAVNKLFSFSPVFTLLTRQVTRNVGIVDGSMKKNSIQERKIIVNRPEKRPYGVRVQFHVQTLGAIGFLEKICILLESGPYLTLSPGKTAPWEAGQRMELSLEGFSTTAAAEASGKRLVQALLWLAIKNKRALQLQYQSYEPVYVFERNRSSGIPMHSYGDSGLPPKLVINSLHDNYLSLPEPEASLLLSMEIFAGAKLETSERATYLSMVSALEVLAKEKSYGENVDNFIQETLANLKDQTNLPSYIRDSLVGRINQLRKESIRQALKRLISEAVPEKPDAHAILDEAYGIRSQIVHNGKPDDLDIDLNKKSEQLEEILISIYSNKLKLKN